MDIRYVGTRGGQPVVGARTTTIRARTSSSNGFLDEFRLAMGNLQANNASGVATRAGSFAYFGAGTGTCRCRSILAYMNGSQDGQSRGLLRRDDVDRTPPSPGGCVAANSDPQVNRAGRSRR